MWVYKYEWVCLFVNISPETLVGSESSEHDLFLLVFLLGLWPTLSHLWEYSPRRLFHHPMLQMFGKLSARDWWVTRICLFKSAQRCLVPISSVPLTQQQTLLSPTPEGSDFITSPQTPSQSFPSSLLHLWASFPPSTKQSIWKLSPTSSQNSISESGIH